MVLSWQEGGDAAIDEPCRLRGQDLKAAVRLPSVCPASFTCRYSWVFTEKGLLQPRTVWVSEAGFLRFSGMPEIKQQSSQSQHLSPHPISHWLHNEGLSAALCIRDTRTQNLRSC